MRLVFSILSSALPLITSLILITWFEKSCNTHLVISEKIQYGATPLRLFELGLRLQFLMTVVCCLGIVIRPAHPVFAFGVSVWITILSVFLSLSSVAAAKDFSRFLEMTKTFKGDLEVDMGRLYDTVEYLQTTHKCCGLVDHNDYKLSKLKTYLTIENKMESFADVPKSCCIMELKGCNLNVLNGVSGRINRDEGCYKVIVESASQCKSNLLSWTMVILFLQATYLNVLTWAHLRSLQNLSFWNFCRVRRCPAFGPDPTNEDKSQSIMEMIPNYDIDSALVFGNGPEAWKESKASHLD